MSVSGRIARNTATKWLASLTAAVTAVFLVNFQMGRLGQSGYGTAELVTTIVYLSILTDLGLRAALSRHLAEQVALGDTRRMNELFNSALAVYLALGLTLAGFFAIFAEPLATALKVPHEQHTAVVFLLRYYVTVTTFVSFVAPSYAAVLEAHHRFDLVDFVHITEVVLRAIGVVALLSWTSSGLYGWAAAMLAAKVIAFASYAFWAHRTCPALEIRPRYLTGNALNYLFTLSGWVFLYQTVLQINTLTDPLVISRYLGPDGVALYKPALLVVVSAYPFVAGLSRQMKPLVTAYQATGQQSHVEEVLVRGTRMTILMAIPFGVVFGCFAYPIANVWLGNQLGQQVAVTAWALLLLSLADLSTHLRETQGFVMLGINRMRFVTLVQAAGGLVSLACGILLVGLLRERGWGMYSVVGVAIPSVVVGWTQLAMISMYVGREIGLGAGRYFWAGFARGFVVLGLTAGVAVSLLLLLRPTTLVPLIACTAITGVVWLLASWYIGCDGPDQMRIRALWNRMRHPSRPTSVAS